MTPLQRALLELRVDLPQLDLRWALIGGLAVSIRSEPRTTRDIDLAVAVSGDLEAEGVVRDFLSRGYRLEQSPLEQRRGPAGDRPAGDDEIRVPRSGGRFDVRVLGH